MRTRALGRNGAKKAVGTDAWVLTLSDPHPAPNAQGSLSPANRAALRFFQSQYHAIPMEIS